MYELSAPENEGRVLLQHKVCISVACEMCCPIWDSIALMKYGCGKYGKNNVTYTRSCLVISIHIFHSYDEICELQYLCLLGT